MKKKSLYVVALFLAVAIALTVCFASSWGKNWNVKTWFNYWGKGEQAQPDVSDKDTSGDIDSEDDLLIVVPVDERGIEFLSAKLPRSAYAANGVSDAVSTAYVVTAVISPEDATDKTVDWDISFVNSLSDWASGKNVTDYVTVTPSYDGALTAIVANLAAFGEQIVVTVTSRDNLEAYATCTVDYLQAVESVSLKIGTLAVNFGGDTNVTVFVGKNYGGEGGVITLEKTLSSVYTIAQIYTEEVTFTGGNPASVTYGSEYVSFYSGGSMGGSWKVNYDDLENPIGRSMYFDRRLFSDYHFVDKVTHFNGTLTETVTLWSDITGTQIVEVYWEYSQGKKFWDITVTLTGSLRSYAYESALRWASYNLDASVDDVEFETPDMIF